MYMCALNLVHAHVRKVECEIFTSSRQIRQICRNLILASFDKNPFWTKTTSSASTPHLTLPVIEIYSALLKQR